MPKRYVKQTVEAIKKDFIEFLETEEMMDDYVSAFVVGSLIGEDYEVGRENDLDLRVIFKEMDRVKAIKIRDFMSRCITRYSTRDLRIDGSSVIGIARPGVGENYSLLIHLIYFDMEEFQKLPVIHTNTYIKYHQHLKGTPIWKLKSVRLTVDNVLYDNEGLMDCLHMLETGKMKYLQWETLDDGKYSTVMHERSIQPHEMTGCIKYALFKPIINALNLYHVHTNDVTKTTRELLSDRRFHGVPYKETVLKYLELKDRRLSEDEKEELKNNVIHFLKSFVKYLQKNELKRGLKKVKVIYEIEDRGRIRKILEETRHIFVKKQKEALIYMNNDSSEEVIRIMVTPDSHYVSYRKGFYGAVQEIINTEILEPETVFNLFRKLGFKPEAILFRKKLHYTNLMQDITVTINTTHETELVEVEKVVEDGKEDKQFLEGYAQETLGLTYPLSKEGFEKKVQELKEAVADLDWNEVFRYINE